MHDHQHLASCLKSLEEQLLDSQTRQSAETVAALLADDFIEFGSSGRVWNKRQIVDALRSESTIRREMSDFKVLRLAADAALVAYRVARYEDGAAPTCTLRSSVWKRTDGAWKLLFHQGTITES